MDKRWQLGAGPEQVCQRIINADAATVDKAWVESDACQQDSEAKKRKKRVLQKYLF